MKRRGLPGKIENEAYQAVLAILRPILEGKQKVWMNTDLLLGIIQSGVDRAIAEFKMERWKQRKAKRG